MRRNLLWRVVQILAVAIRIALEAAIAKSNVEHSIRPKRDAAAVMVECRLLHIEQATRRHAGIVQQIFARLPLDDRRLHDSLVPPLDV